MQRFFDEYGIKSISIPPYHSQSNGLAERTIQSFKNFVKKNGCSAAVEHKFCYFHNFSPLGNTFYCPASEILSYKPRTHTHLETPVLINHTGKGWSEAVQTGRMGNTCLLRSDACNREIKVYDSSSYNHSSVGRRSTSEGNSDELRGDTISSALSPMECAM